MYLKKEKTFKETQKSDQSFQPSSGIFGQFPYFNTLSLEPQGLLLAERDQLERQGVSSKRRKI